MTMLNSENMPGLLALELVKATCDKGSPSHAINTWPCMPCIEDIRHFLFHAKIAVNESVNQIMAAE